MRVRQEVPCRSVAVESLKAGVPALPRTLIGTGRGGRLGPGDRYTLPQQMGAVWGKPLICLLGLRPWPLFRLGSSG